MADLVTGWGGHTIMNAPVAWWGRTRSGERRSVVALRSAVVLLALVATAVGTVAAATEKAGEALAATNEIPSLPLADLAHALLCMAVAALLGAGLALRPRRAGGPPRLAHVIQTQIMLAIIGSLVMLIVGASLARAFAIAGVAGLVRYRSKIDDPKDASVMLACLAVGLASGVGLLYLASAGAAFMVVVLWALEWREPWPPKHFELKVLAKDPAAVKAEVETLLTKYHIKFELRESTEKHIAYSALVPQGARTQRISEAIAALHGAEAVDVTWEEKKAAK
jgi:hypothetical protein